jgi:hypothetical protein
MSKTRYLIISSPTFDTSMAGSMPAQRSQPCWRVLVTVKTVSILLATRRIEHMQNEVRCGIAVQVLYIHIETTT